MNNFTSFSRIRLASIKLILYGFLLVLSLFSVSCDTKTADQLITPQSTTAKGTNLRLGAAEPQSTNQLTTNDLIDVDPSQLRPYPSSTHGVMAISSRGSDGVPFPVQCYVDGKYVGTLKEKYTGPWNYNAPASDKRLYVALTPGQHIAKFRFPDGRCMNYQGDFAYARPFEYTGGFDIWMMVLRPCDCGRL